jgi:uncharacterized membrane protein YfcA
MNTTPIQINRKYTVMACCAYFVTAILASIECVLNGHAFHLPLFAFFCFAYIVGAIAAIKYNVMLERRVLKVCFYVVVICIVANLYLLFRINIGIAVRNLIIVGSNLIWILFRSENLNWLMYITERTRNE